MSTDLEKARQEVINAAIEWAGATTRSAHFERQLLKAVEALLDRDTSSDGGRMNENSIGGENV